MQKTYLTQAEVAKLIGKRSSNVAYHLKPGGCLREAYDEKTKRVDMSHKAAKAFLKSHGVQASRATSAPTATKANVGGRAARNNAKAKAAHDPNALPSSEPPEYLKEYLDLPLRSIIAKFATDQRFVDWVKAHKEIEAVREKALKNDEREALLLPRQIFEKVIGEFERCHLLLLEDGSKTMAAHAVNMVKSGRTAEEIQAEFEDQIGSPILTAKQRIAKWLKEYQNDVG